MTATIELYSNNANTILAAGITSSATTLTVAPGSGAEFPSPVFGQSFFRITLTGASSPNTVEEICYVTLRSGDVFTVLRGREGTTAVAWSVNDLCYNAATAGTYSQFMQPYYGVDTNGSNAYVISNQTAASAYYTGMPASFSTISVNTITNPTLDVNGLGASVIKNASGVALQVGQIATNTIQVCYYNATDNSWRLQTPSYGETISNIGYVPVNVGGDTMTGALTNSYGFYGPLFGTLTGGWAYMPSGTTAVFYQASAPTGWTQVTTQNDAALRVVSGVGGGGGGTNPFSSAFTSIAVTGSVSISTATGTVGGTALTVSQMPSHGHSVNDPGHSHSFNMYAATSGGPNGPTDGSVNGLAGYFGTYGAFTGITIAATGGGATHAHSLSMDPQSASFTGNNINLSVKYINTIICSKN